LADSAKVVSFSEDDAALPPGDRYPAALPPGVDEAQAPPPRRRIRLRHVFAGIVALFLLLFAWLALTAPLSKSLQPIVPPGITLLADDGTPIARRGPVTDQPVKVSELPKFVPGAFVAIEDKRFYRHWGVDPHGVARALWHNLRAGGVREGGSTITQQLAKLAFLNSKRTFGRKFQEMLIAFWLEGWLTKDEILSRYLSSVYFGDNVYGLRAAARHYFSRDPEDLTPEQAALLAGMMKSPSRLAPTENLRGARARSRQVIAAMVGSGYLTRAQAARLRPARLKVAPARNIPTGTYFADWVLPQARAAAGNGYGDQTIKTTLNVRLQALALRTVRSAPLGKSQVAIVAMRPDGAVVAMVGGKDYGQSTFNRVTQARRQPGSTFKLFVYLAALRSGMTPDSMVEDKPFRVGTWAPKNADGHYRGPITLKQAFAVSSNVAAVRLSEQVGRANVIRAARDLGITSPLVDEPSVALGTSAATLMEMTQAYAAVAGNIYPVQAHGLPQGEEGWIAAIRGGFRRFQESSTRLMLLDLLSAAANEGTGRAAALPIPTFGKTGTSQDNRDALFIGFAGDLITAVWIGNDDNSPLGSNMVGGGLPARLWRDFMGQALAANAVARPVGGAPAPVAIPQTAPPGDEDMGPPDPADQAGQPDDNGPPQPGDQGPPPATNGPPNGPADRPRRLPDAPPATPPPAPPPQDQPTPQERI
jgi:penicillin-binding protein 1A